MTLQDLYVRYEAALRPVLRVAPVFGGLALLTWRMRETRVPVTAKSILIPPLAMSTGFFMFFSPLTRVPWSWAVTSLAAGGLVLSWPLVRTSRLEPRDGRIYMRRSPWFLAILLGLLAIRLALHDYVGHLISPLQTASVFYLLAFGMIVRWRAGMYWQYRGLTPRG
ncbi:MAG: cytochrome c biogenesis protein CcdC [Vicinamibacterales bacterium]